MVVVSQILVKTFVISKVPPCTVRRGPDHQNKVVLRLWLYRPSQRRIGQGLLEKTMTVRNEDNDQIIPVRNSAQSCHSRGKWYL